MTPDVLDKKILFFQESLQFVKDIEYCTIVERVIEPTIYFTTGTALAWPVCECERWRIYWREVSSHHHLYISLRLTCYTSHLLLQPQACLDSPDSASANQTEVRRGEVTASVIGNY